MLWLRVACAVPGADGCARVKHIRRMKTIWEATGITRDAQRTTPPSFSSKCSFETLRFYTVSACPRALNHIKYRGRGVGKERRNAKHGFSEDTAEPPQAAIAGHDTTCIHATVV